MRTALAAAAVVGLAGAVNAQVMISEILGSTSGSDWEYFEIVNMGSTAIDLTGWSLELWDSDAGSGFGGADGGAPYVFGSAILNPGQAFAMGNSLATGGYADPPFHFGGSLVDNAIENSAYTAILADAGSNVIDAVYVSDGGDGDMANRAGAAITVNMVVGPDGTFLPAGFARTDAVGGWTLLNFDTSMLGDGTIAGGTPGINQIPAPGAVAMVGLGGVAIMRRRR